MAGNPDEKIRPENSETALVNIHSYGGSRIASFQLFVRWNLSHNDAGGTVELTKDGEVILSSPCGNNDRVYGFCMAIANILNRMGSDIMMPNCLRGHFGPNRGRED